MRADEGMPLWVDPGVHGAECRRFDSYVVKGPTTVDWDFFSGAVGKRDYGRNCLADVLPAVSGSFEWPADMPAGDVGPGVSPLSVRRSLAHL